MNDLFECWSDETDAFIDAMFDWLDGNDTCNSTHQTEYVLTGFKETDDDLPF